MLCNRNDKKLHMLYSDGMLCCVNLVMDRHSGFKYVLLEL